jgi:hypothetical protein
MRRFDRVTVMSRTRVVVLTALVLAVPAACGDSGVVGGECRTGYTLCNGHCIDMAHDPNNCGACGHVCPSGAACVNALCGGSLDGSAGAGGTSGAGDIGGATTGGEGDSGGRAGNGGNSGVAGISGNAGVSGLDGGNPNDAATDAPICNDPIDTAQNCGACNNVCMDPTPFCAPNGAGTYHCVKDCGMLTLCGDDCVDLNVDPDHCGNCSTVCPSGICQGGMCVGANVGHVVAACDDYAQATQNAPQVVLLGNTVLLPLRNAVRILAYTQYTPATVSAHVTTLVDGAATGRGRMMPTITNLTDYNQLSAQLDIANIDVFLIEDQSAAPAGQLATVGAAWQATGAIDSFARAGGVVMVLAGATGRGQMSDFLTSSQLLAVSAQALANTTTLYNRAPADAVGINVISPLVGQRNTCSFSTSVSESGDTVFVIEDAAAPTLGNPSVVHRVIVP